MPLTNHQIRTLGSAITTYRFPTVYFDCSLQRQINASGMSVVEHYIGPRLRSAAQADVGCGLRNVLHWGYAQVGYGVVREKKFCANITPAHISGFIALTHSPSATPNLIDIAKLRMPEYSGISFVSKILMFLNPSDYCTLDLQLTKLRTSSTIHRAIGQLKFTSQIGITRHNQSVYDAWRRECRDISNTYYGGRYRVADIERGFFHLIQKGDLANAIDIYASF